MVTEQTQDAATTPVESEASAIEAEAPIAEAPIAEAAADAPVAAPVEAAPLAPIAEAPEPALPVEEPSQGPSARETALEQELAAARQREVAQQQAYQQAANLQSARSAAAQKAEQLVQQGQFLPEQAQQLTEYFLPYETQALQLHQQAQAYAQHLEAKNNAAAEYATKYGVPHTNLMKFDSRDQMEEYAKTQSRIKLLEEREAKRTKAQVPAQTFSPGVTEASTGELEGAALEDAVGSGAVDLTPAVVERLIRYQRSQGYGG